MIAAFLPFAGASVADETVPAGSLVLASGLVHRSLPAFALPPVSRDAGRCPVGVGRGPRFGQFLKQFLPTRHGKAWSPLSHKLHFCATKAFLKNSIEAKGANYLEIHWHHFRGLIKEKKIAVSKLTRNLIWLMF
jgi:hypothetical protein